MVIQPGPLSKLVRAVYLTELKQQSMLWTKEDYPNYLVLMGVSSMVKVIQPVQLEMNVALM